MELCDKTAAELAVLLRKGEVSSREITESVYKRIDETEEAVNAYITLTRETALKQADRADKRFRREKEPPAAKRHSHRREGPFMHQRDKNHMRLQNSQGLCAHL